MSIEIKGWVHPSGYMGYIYWVGDYMLFSTEDEYIDYVEEHEKDEES